MLGNSTGGTLLGTKRNSIAMCACPYRTSSSQIRLTLSAVTAGTPWVIGGDVETLLPYLAFHLPTPTFIRRWLSVDADEPPRRKVRHESVHILNGAADFDDRKNGNIGDRKIPCGDKVDCHSEAIALDLALPEAGLDSSKPFYVMLHGLNGGSAEVCPRGGGVETC